MENIKTHFPKRMCYSPLGKIFENFLYYGKYVNNKKYECSLKNIL